MLFYQVELIKHGHDTCLEFMEFAASGDYAETQAHFHSTMEITVIAVSYTHLDVYKRQQEARRSNAITKQSSRLIVLFMFILHFL